MRLNSRVFRLESAMRPVAIPTRGISDACRQACEQTIRMMYDNPDLCTDEELQMLEELRRRRQSEAEGGIACA